MVEICSGTAFAYGQTSSGKTFTMNGTQNDPGIIQRAVNEIFQKIEMVYITFLLVTITSLISRILVCSY